MIEVKSVLAYLLIVSYFVVERLLRKGEKALSLQAGEFDRGSSRILLMSGLFNIFLVLAAPVLNAYQIGNWRNGYVGWFGILLMLSGLGLRYWAARTLGEFYTRTLQITEDQQIVDLAPYSVIRHPGYLGTYLMVIGAGFAIANYPVLSLAAIIGLLSRIYRIQAEEKMIAAAFPKTYETYSAKTWRLIPFLY